MNKRLLQAALVGLSIGLAFSLAAPAMAQRKSKAERQKEHEERSKEAIKKREEEIQKGLSSDRPVVYTRAHLDKANRQASSLTLHYGIGIADADFKVLGEFKKLETLSLFPRGANNFKTISGVAVDELSKLQSLKKLSFRHEFPPVMIRKLASLASCTQMTLLFDKDLSNSDATALESLAQVEELSICGANATGDPLFASLSKLSGLKLLSIDGTKQTKHVGKEWEALIQQYGKELAGQYRRPPNKTAKGNTLSALRKLKNLETLKIKSFALVSDAKFASAFKDSEKLLRVAIETCEKAGDSTARAISKLKKVQAVSMLGTAIGSSGAKSLAKNESIEYINVSYCENIDDNALSAIASSDNLKGLAIFSSTITASGVQRLTKLKDSLKVLSVGRPGESLKNVSSAVWEKMRQEMPDTKINAY